jgi:hypothetical protein
MKKICRAALDVAICSGQKLFVRREGRGQPCPQAELEFRLQPVLAGNKLKLGLQLTDSAVSAPIIRE